MDPITIAILVGVVLIAGCSSSNDDEGGATQGTPSEPIADPPSKDTTIPDSPRNDLDTCYEPTSSFQVMVDLKGAFHRLVGGTTSPEADGCLVIAVDRESICMAGEPCDTATGRLLQAGSNETRKLFRAVGRLASMPAEISGLTAVMYQSRQSGAPLRDLGNDWGTIYPEFQDSIGFVWMIDGDIDATNCHVTMTLRSAARNIENDNLDNPFGHGYTDVLPNTALPYYTQNGMLSCTPTSTYDNEGLVVLDAALTATLPGPDQAARVCDNNCTDVTGAVNPRTADLTLINQPFSPPAPPAP